MSTLSSSLRVNSVAKPVSSRVRSLKQRMKDGWYEKHCHFESTWKTWEGIPRLSRRKELKAAHPYYFLLRQMVHPDTAIPIDLPFELPSTPPASTTTRRCRPRVSTPYSPRSSSPRLGPPLKRQRSSTSSSNESDSEVERELPRQTVSRVSSIGPSVDLQPRAMSAAGAGLSPGTALYRPQTDCDSDSDSDIDSDSDSDSDTDTDTDSDTDSDSNSDHEDHGHIKGRGRSHSPKMLPNSIKRFKVTDTKAGSRVKGTSFESLGGNAHTPIPVVDSSDSSTDGESSDEEFEGQTRVDEDGSARPEYRPKQRPKESRITEDDRPSNFEPTVRLGLYPLTHKNPFQDGLVVLEGQLRRAVTYTSTTSVLIGSFNKHNIPLKWYRHEIRDLLNRNPNAIDVVSLRNRANTELKLEILWRSVQGW
ncbi:hypothetical protein IAR55_006974 [Kwoniella newhampshirensis]|uniref:Chromo domain-containing protein n=1 Tax=Kwoniella newhampshirensis TaxID=1651941 RepID=A0AAW0YD47_9TREE